MSEERCFECDGELHGPFCPACRDSKPAFEEMVAGPDGWTDWVRPLPGYLMKCCDCGGVHEMEARVGRIVERHADGRFEWDCTENDEAARDLVVMFRMRRPVGDA